MRRTYRVLAFVIAAEVVIQAMAIAFALAGLGKWVGDEGGVLNKQTLDDSSTSYTGAVGFAIHGINGEMLIPLFVLALLVVSFFAHVPGGTRLAAIIVGLVVLQVALGIGLHGLPYLALLHAANAFAILGAAVGAGVRARGGVVPATTSVAQQSAVPAPRERASETQALRPTSGPSAG
jgi:hypothetical protein